MPLGAAKDGHFFLSRVVPIRVNDQPVIPVNLLQLSFTGALQHSFNVALLLIAAAARRLKSGGVRVAAYRRGGAAASATT